MQGSIPVPLRATLTGFALPFTVSMGWDTVLSRLVHTVKDTISPVTLPFYSTHCGARGTREQTCGSLCAPSRLAQTPPALPQSNPYLLSLEPCHGFFPIFYCKYGSGYSTVRFMPPGKSTKEAVKARVERCVGTRSYEVVTNDVARYIVAISAT